MRLPYPFYEGEVAVERYRQMLEYYNIALYAVENRLTEIAHASLISSPQFPEEIYRGGCPN